MRLQIIHSKKRTTICGQIYAPAKGSEGNENYDNRTVIKFC